MSMPISANLGSARLNEDLMQHVADYPPRFEMKVSDINDYISLYHYMLAAVTATDKFMEYFSGHKSTFETTPTTDKFMKYFSGTATARYYVYFEDETQGEVKKIRDWYVEKVSQTLEAEALLYKQHGKNIEFVVVVDHIRRDHSFQLSDIACEIDDLYPNWSFGFQYVSIHTAGQLPLDDFSDLINDG